MKQHPKYHQLLYIHNNQQVCNNYNNISRCGVIHQIECSWCIFWICDVWIETQMNESIHLKAINKKFKNNQSTKKQNTEQMDFDDNLS